MPSAERIAFNPNNYSGLDKDQIKKQASRDLAAMTQEMAPRSQEPITAFTLLVDFNAHKVTSPDFSLESLDKHTASDMTGIATLKIIDHLLEPTNYNTDQSVAIVWISGPGQDFNDITYTESRYNIYFGNRINDKAYIRSYGGLATQHSEDECIQNGNWLKKFSQDPTTPDFSDITTLRLSPIVIDIPPGIDPLDYIESRQTTINTQVWQRIRTGQAETVYNQALEVTTQAVEKFANELAEAVTPEQKRRVAAKMERFTIDHGYSMVSSSGGHGGLNSESGSGAVPSMSISGEKHWFVKNCGNCKVTLYKWMKKNDTCPCCHGVYEGC